MAFAIGENVGPYRITDRLGQGGMATVFRAYHAKLDRYVAIKVLHPAFNEDASFLSRFQREAQIVARLEHPHIVPIYDSNDHEGQPYLVMKFIEGQTLKGRLNDKPLTLDETTRIITAVSQALTYAHEQGVLHRDIKPSNILIEKGVTPYLADFGLARMAGAGESTMSQDMMLGTPQYISPEQAQGVKDLDAGTDIYSLGVVLYELLVGRVPFSADTPYAIVHDHIFAPLPLPSSVNPQVPAAVEHVLLKALAKDRRDRYASAVQMADAFRKAVEDSNLTEFSAASYRVPPGANGSRAGSITGTPLLPSSTPPPTAILGAPSFVGGMAGSSATPIPSVVSQMQSLTALRRREQHRRRSANLWILGGFTGLILTILTGVVVSVAAFTDPAIRSSLFVQGPPAQFGTRPPIGGGPGGIGPGGIGPSATPSKAPPRTEPATAKATGTSAATMAATANNTSSGTSAVQPEAVTVVTTNATADAAVTVTPGPTKTRPSLRKTETAVASLTVTPAAATNGPTATSILEGFDLTPSLDFATLPPNTATEAAILAPVVIPVASSFEEAQRLVDQNNTSAANWFSLTLAAIEFKKSLRVKPSLTKALELAGASEPTLMAAARAFNGQNDLDISAYLYARLLTLPNVPESDHDEATQMLYNQAKKTTPANAAIFTSIAHSFPELAAGQTFKALATFQLGLTDEANATMTTALQLDPHAPEAHLVQGLLYAGQNQASKAKTEFQTARDAANAPKWVVDEAKSALKTL